MLQQLLLFTTSLLLLLLLVEGCRADEDPPSSSLFSSWPPPPSTWYTSVECFIGLHACYEDQVVVRHFCPSAATTTTTTMDEQEERPRKEDLTFVMKMEEYLRASMDAQIQSSNDFCEACRSHCSRRNGSSTGKDEHNTTNSSSSSPPPPPLLQENKSHYWFAWREGDDDSLIFHNGGAKTNPLRYDCESCLQECDQINTDVIIQQQQQDLSSCSAIAWPDDDNSSEAQTYYTGPHCVQERSGVTMPRLAVYSNRSSCEASDAEYIVDVLEDIESHYGSTAQKMWGTMIGQNGIPLACLPPNLENTTEPSDSTTTTSGSSNWCQELMKQDSVIPCTSIVDGDITADSTLQNFCNQALALELRPESTPFIGRVIFDLPFVTPPGIPPPPVTVTVTAVPSDEEEQDVMMTTIHDVSGNSLQLQQCLRTELLQPSSSSSAGDSSSWTSTARQRQYDPSIIGHQVEQQPPIASYVLFQLCIQQQSQKNTSSSVDTCSNCQDYVVDLETYLRFTTHQTKSLSQKSCSDCNAQCSWSDESTTTTTTTRAMICDGCWKHADTSSSHEEQGGDSHCWYTSENDDAWYLYSGFTTTTAFNDANDNNNNQTIPASCDFCLSFCQKMESMEQNGYLDATDFHQCQMIYYPESLDTEEILYAGPYCHDGERIKIGVFTDELCQQMDPAKDVENYLRDADGYGMKLAYSVLMGATKTDLSYSCQISYDGDRVELNEMCEQLYSRSVPCGDDEAIAPLAIARQGAIGRLDESTYQYMQSLCPGSNSSFVEFNSANQNDENNNAEPSEENDDSSSIPAKTIDISGSSLQFQRCIQFESEWIDGTLPAANELSRNGYVLFQICWDHSGKDTCSGCRDYVIELSKYLEYTSSLTTEPARDACDKCYAGCTDSTPPTTTSRTGAPTTKICDNCLLTRDSSGTEEDEKYCWTMSQEDPNWYLYQAFVSTTTSINTDTPVHSCEDCRNFCKDLYPMDNDFVDATMFSGCEIVYDPEDDGQSQIFAGAYCSRENEVKIGAFTDESCQVLTSVLNVKDYLFDNDGFQMQLTYQFLNPLLKQDQSLSCTELQPEHDQPLGDAHSRYCQWLHDDAVPCATQSSALSTAVDRDDTTIQYMKSLCPPDSTATADDTSIGYSGTNGIDNASSASASASACSARNFAALSLRGLLLGYLWIVAF